MKKENQIYTIQTADSEQYTRWRALKCVGLDFCFCFVLCVSGWLALFVIWECVRFDLSGCNAIYFVMRVSKMDIINENSEMRRHINEQKHPIHMTTNRDVNFLNVAMNVVKIKLKNVHLLQANRMYAIL